MKKDREWLKENVSSILYRAELRDAFVGTSVGNIIYDEIEAVIDQLDEPELTQKQVDKWLDDRDMVAVDTMFIHHQGLHNKVIVEKPAIPQFVADYIKIAKKDIPLIRVFDIANNFSEMAKWKKEYNWIRSNSNLFARAWLDGYEVAKEPHYYVAFESEFNLLYVTHVDIYGENGKVNYNSESDKNRAMKFTDKSRAKNLADFLGATVVEEVTE